MVDNNWPSGMEMLEAGTVPAEEYQFQESTAEIEEIPT